ncbi:MAG: CPBP family intramembrane metalloprotease [Chlorobium limicola]|uniref:Abortive infection protein n=1 Tax=Chlorobium limicola (strain DSM 245 / NBRC 103803 / 6330) TaxID=290315 RepID=B3EFA3_CHLL2|nr:CPBP family intramembrane glutamic endopeptidase [Chlorobium limicola]ACD89386.1 Abortive infection protein [Chlorobium limicola DSM 245]NTV20209.1 CPBP family intramembrane metalloprotease [Chlorobium limicola]
MKKEHFLLSESTVSVHRPSFVFTTAMLLLVMLLYAVAGSLFFLLLSGGGVPAVQNAAMFDRSAVAALRISQVAGQILVLALPAGLLAGFHVRGKRLLSREPLVFLGIKGGISWRQVLFAVLGMVCLQPLLHSITELQDIFLWPALGTAGKDVLESRQQMDALLEKLAGMHSLSEAMAVAGVLALTPACCEEIFFRGYLQQNYARSLSPLASVFFTGFVFAVFHLSAANLVPLTLLGWYIGYVFMQSGNLAVPFSVHLLNNLAALLVLHFSGESSSIPGESVVFSLWWWFAVAGGLLLFLFFMQRLRAACD